jgi:hypothetical protein
MPQGKGTYGSKVGRPPKKKYNKGGNVDPFSTRNPVGVPAEQMAEAMENQNMANAGLPTSNAQERSQVSPDVEQYKEGGKIEDWKEEGYEWSTNELKRRVFAQERGTDVTDLVKLRSRRKKEVEKAKKGKK